MTQSLSIDGQKRSALVVAHPGHEIRAYGWYERAKPTLFALTNGSGSRGDDRLGYSRQIAAQIGVPVSPLFGSFSDIELYDTLLAHDARPFLAWTNSLAAALVELNPAMVVVDSWQMYNVAHDLVHVITRTAVEHARYRSGHHIRLVEFDPAPITLSAGPLPRADEAFRIELDDAALARKLSAADRSPSLRDEMDAILVAEGMDAQRIEIYRDLCDPSSLTVPPGAVPPYEQFGAQRVAVGRYQECIRWQEHVAPIAAAIRAARL